MAAFGLSRMILGFEGPSVESMPRTDVPPKIEGRDPAPEGPRLLVGVDGGEGGRDVLELGRVLGSIQGATCSAATVPTRGPDRGGSPAQVLLERAEREGVKLLIVGSPHRGPIGRALIGNVTKGVLHGAPCEVAVAPHGYAAVHHDPYRAIAVAYDGTPEAKAALRRAESLALLTNATIEVLTVVSPPAAMPGPGVYVPSQPPEADKILNEAIHSVDPALGARGRCLDGDPATMLARACEDRVDLLVAGSRGYGPVARVLFGCVTARLVQDPPCPVLVVPRQPG